MQSKPSRRKRGITLSPQGWQKLQRAIAESEDKENFGEKYTLQQVSEHAGIVPATIAKVLNRTKSVDSRTIERIFRAFSLELEPDDYNNPVLSFSKIKPEEARQNRDTYTDWERSPKVPAFYGRTEELATLQKWIVKDRCCLVALLGMGGIGKTALSAKLAELIQGEFEYVIWRSIHNSPPLNDVLENLLQCFSSPPKETTTDLCEDNLSQLMGYLSQHRCLLILDNTETILGIGNSTGQYREAICSSVLGKSAIKAVYY
jgi:ATP-dependent Clp protease ATP-binding subunit ClpA